MVLYCLLGYDGDHGSGYVHKPIRCVRVPGSVVGSVVSHITATIMGTSFSIP